MIDRYRIELTEQADGGWWWRLISFRGKTYTRSKKVYIDGGHEEILLMATAAAEARKDRDKKNGK